MNVEKVEVGQQRGPGDGSKRFTCSAMSFDTRAHVLATEIGEDWEPEVQEQWRSNKQHVREVLIHAFGSQNYEEKIQNFADLGPAPWSVVALHNTYLEQVRSAFTATYYYPALLGACGLGERILNQLVLILRDDYARHPATTHVAKKKSFDDWRKCIRTLSEWGVFSDDVASDYLRLMEARHAAVHYRTELDSGDARNAALSSVRLLSSLVERLFTPHGGDPHYFNGPIGRSYVRLESESDPFIRHFVLPACVLVSPRFRFVSSSAGCFDVYDAPSIGADDPPLSDEEFAEPRRASPQVPHPF